MRPMTTRSDALVFFGATGDLAFKQTFPALQALAKSGRLDMPVVCVGRKDMPLEKMKARAKESLDKAGLDEEGWKILEKNLRYAAVDYENAKSFESIVKQLGDAKHPLFYVALPPDVYESVAKDLFDAGLAKDARLVLEKPFGSDEASAKKLSETIHAWFPEDSLFRIDHYLGKESVENIVFMRAANCFVERMLHCDYVESVEITMAEKFGVEGRAKFYDAVGAIRDVVQNHLLKIIVCLAMDLPTSENPEALRGARAKLLASIRPIDPMEVVRGQVEGYLEERGVAKNSKTETYAALKVYVDTPRWKDVPFVIRTGKALMLTRTEVLIRLKRLEQAVLDSKSPPEPNHLRFRLSPEIQIGVGVSVKAPGQAMRGEAKDLVLERSAGEGLQPYERLLGDAIDDDHELYARQDAVESSWRVVGPALGGTEVFPYEKGSMGPKEADRVAPPGGWSRFIP